MGEGEGPLTLVQRIYARMVTIREQGERERRGLISRCLSSTGTVPRRREGPMDISPPSLSNQGNINRKLCVADIIVIIHLSGWWWE